MDGRKKNCSIPPSTQYWWGILSRSAIVFCPWGAFPASKAQWLVLPAIPGGTNHWGKTWQAGCTQINWWIDLCTTREPIPGSKFHPCMASFSLGYKKTFAVATLAATMKTDSLLMGHINHKLPWPPQRAILMCPIRSSVRPYKTQCMHVKFLITTDFYSL